MQDGEHLYDVLLLVDFYRRFIGDKKADQGNREYGIEGGKECLSSSFPLYIEKHNFVNRSRYD